MYNVVDTIETGMHNAASSAMDSLLMLGWDLLKSQLTLARQLILFVLGQDRRKFSEDTDGLQRIASCTFNSNTNLDKIDETLGNFNVEAGKL